MQSPLKQIQVELHKRARRSVKATAQKFVPTSQRVYGVSMPVANELAKKFKDHGFALAEELWQAGAFEERIIAAKLVRFVCKQDPSRARGLVKRWSKDIQDWAVCDTLGMQSLKPLAKKYSEEIFRLAKPLQVSKNLWQRRLSLVLVEELTKYPEHHSRIRSMIARLKDDDEHYVQKAVTWLTRALEKHSKRPTK